MMQMNRQTGNDRPDAFARQSVSSAGYFSFPVNTKKYSRFFGSGNAKGKIHQVAVGYPFHSGEVKPFASL